MKRSKKILIVIGIVVVAVAAAAVIYLNDYYRAAETAQQCIASPAEGVEVIAADDGITVFSPVPGEGMWGGYNEKPEAGVIFYPGGKVEAESYAPLMEALAERNILAVLVSMPGNLAVLDMDAAEGIQEMFPEIDRWYMAGHSLGGSMAASYLSKTDEVFDGLILLASYSTEDLSDADMEVLSVYGDQDGVLDMEKYDQNKENLPAGFREYVIEGGCHAYFGDYGVQDGDGSPAITAEEQIWETADVIQIFIFDYSV